MQYVFSCWQPCWHKTMGYLQYRVSGSAVGILDGGYGIFFKISIMYRKVVVHIGTFSSFLYLLAVLD